MTKRSVEFADKLTCPHCGYEDEAAEEMFLDNDSDEREVQCRHCGEEFHAARVLDVSYSSWSYDDDDEPEAA